MSSPVLPPKAGTGERAAGPEAPLSEDAGAASSQGSVPSPHDSWGRLAHLATPEKIKEWMNLPHGEFAKIVQLYDRKWGQDDSGI